MLDVVSGAGSRALPVWVGYLLAVAGTAAAFALTQSFPALFARTPLVLFFVLGGILTLLFGAGPGLATAALSVAAASALRPPITSLQTVGFLVTSLPTIAFIHYHRQAVRALRESDQRYQRLSELSNDIVLFDDLEGRVVWINTAGPKLSGFRLDQIIGHSTLDFVQSEDVERAIAARKTLLADGGPKMVSLEAGLLAADGRPQTFDLRIALRLVDGRPVGFQTVARDVTERRRLEAQLRQSQKMEAVGRLAGGVAHDFNNMLTAIMGYADQTLTSLGPTHARSGELRQLLATCERAAGMVGQLLAFSRQQALRPAVLDPNEVVRGLESMLQRLIGADVILTSRLDPEVGRITADPNQLTQVLMNLAVNARDAMPRGGTLSIETTNTEVPQGLLRSGVPIEPGRYVILAVADTGHGIDEATRAHIFEPFFTTKPEGKGTGLGLATVYGIVKQSGGYVWVDSAPGRGTRFEIYLPQVDRAAEERRQEAAGPEVLTGTETILLAEDDPDVRALAAGALTDLGYTVLSAPDGAEAADLADRRAGAIDLVLTDVVMPWMSGPELVAQVRQTRPSVRVMYMSGFAAAPDGQARSLAADAPLIQKPFTPWSLAREIRGVLDRP